MKETVFAAGAPPKKTQAVDNFDLKVGIKCLLAVLNISHRLIIQ